MIALPVALGFRLLSLFGVKEALAKRFAPLAAIALGLLLVGLAVLAFNLWLDGRDTRNQEIGATVQREGDLRATIERVEKANEAAAKVERDPAARRAGCLRHSRTPENC